MKNLSKVIFAAVLGLLVWIPGPGQAQAQSSMPTVFCGTILTMPYHLIDCSNIGQEHENEEEAQANQVSLSEQKALPRTASVCRPSFGNLVGSLRKIIQKIARSLDMDPRIIEAVAQVESGGNQVVVSEMGAIGIMQLMPGTAKGLGVNPYDPEQNVLGGAMYLKTQINRFGSLPLALAAYNAGPRAVQKYGGIPPYTETINYVSNVMSMLEGGS